MQRVNNFRHLAAGIHPTSPRSYWITTSPGDKTTPRRERAARGWLLESGWWAAQRRGALRPKTPAALWIERPGNEQETGNGCGGQRDPIWIIGSWTEWQLWPAGRCIIRLLPHLVWVTATANVHSALSGTNEGKRLSRSTTAPTGATGGGLTL